MALPFYSLRRTRPFGLRERDASSRIGLKGWGEKKNSGETGAGWGGSYGKPRRVRKRRIRIVASGRRLTLRSKEEKRQEGKRGHSRGAGARIRIANRAWDVGV